MIARKYDYLSDFEQIHEWGLQWGEKYKPSQFPLTGFIVDGVAAYFLYSTDSSVCWLENMVSNKGVSDEVRNEALDLIVEALLREAKDRHFDVAYATTNIIPIIKRAKEAGAHVKPAQCLLIKDLTET